ncbi:hypothetical protein DUI87_27199 [Hirundo rustica rustica]|uniref:Uncharacterized protein n=1 Tax=Hirundo rustica rustica TaxID=333673 RepID=A0A3M0J5Z1_HIRRU|nr:hypothetical protein DUI87_27199 [Hirundo rustica rustica]
MIKLAIFFCILPQYHGQDSSEWPWSEAIVEHTNLLGSYPKGHHPNLATVVQHGSEAYRLNEWGWDQKEWIKTLIGTVGEVIMIACRKVEGYGHEKASSITIAGNFLEADGKNYLYIPTAELCPTKKWNCTKQSPLTLCCRQEYVGLNYDGAILYPSEHKEWARQIGEKWQTVNLESCIVREQQGFICESNEVIAQDVCLDTEQNICHFEIHPNEAPGTVLIYIAILFIMNWRMMKRLTRLTSIINAHNLADILSPMDIPKAIDTRQL